MAKKKTGVNKAAKIREYLEANPTAKGVDVVAALKAKGISVAAAQVSNVKTAADKKKNKASGKGKRGPKAKSIVISGVADSVKAALDLIRAAGGAEQAKRLVDVLTSNKVAF